MRLARNSHAFPSRAGQESVKYESAQFLSGDGVLKHIEVDKNTQTRSLPTIGSRGGNKLEKCGLEQRVDAIGSEITSEIVIEPSTPKKATLNIAFETLGCRSNFADTVDLEAMCMERGANIVRSDYPADVYVINTCSVTDQAEHQGLRLIKNLRSKNPKARIVITGCFAELSADKLIQTGLVDEVVGTGKPEVVIESIFERNIRRNIESILENTVSNCTSDAHIMPITRRHARSRRSNSLFRPLSQQIKGPAERTAGGHYRARFHLRIQEGCENSCTFCIVPFARGGFSSRPAKLILDDLDRLHDLGYKEVVLTGTHLGGYGLNADDNSAMRFDIIQKQGIPRQNELKHDKFKLSVLSNADDDELAVSSLLELLNLIEMSPIHRVRLSSLDPNDISPQMVDFLGSSRKFCPHLHICFQSFSDKLLKLMNRHYSLQQAVDLVNYVKKVIPQCSIGSDLVVGFPGESREDVERAIELFRDLPISYLHVFPYSERSNTPAKLFDGQVGIAERRVRAREWREIDQDKRSAFRRGFVGQELEVIVEAHPPEMIFGTSREYLPVKVPLYAENYLPNETTKCPEIGQLVTVIVKNYDIQDGKLICAFMDRESSKAQIR